MQCPNCGRECNPGDNFCSRCGAVLMVAETKAPDITLDGLIAQYRQKISTEPDNAEAHYNLGLAYMHKGLYDLAIIAFEKVRSLTPDFPDVHHHLGFLYRKKRMVEQAIAEFEKSLKLDPNQPKIRRILEKLKGG